MTVLPDAHITRHTVIIDGVELTMPIREGGVTVRPGGYKDVNVITVEFMVGKVRMDDPYKSAESP